LFCGSNVAEIFITKYTVEQSETPVCCGCQFSPISGQIPNIILGDVSEITWMNDIG
jgi:hypothetical protein